MGSKVSDALPPEADALESVARRGGCGTRAAPAGNHARFGKAKWAWEGEGPAESRINRGAKWSTRRICGLQEMQKWAGRLQQNVFSHEDVKTGQSRPLVTAGAGLAARQIPGYCLAKARSGARSCS